MVDAETRGDSVEVKPNRHLIYHFTLVNYAKDQIDTTIAKKTMEPNIKNLVTNTAGLKEFREKEVDFLYLYHDKNGKYAFSIEVTHEEYNKKQK